MGAYLHQEVIEEGFPKELRKMKICFFCGEPLKDNKKDIGGIILWQGVDATIALHQCCAELLSIHLIQDSRSLVSITGMNCKLQETQKREMKHLWHYKNVSK